MILQAKTLRHHHLNSSNVSCTIIFMLAVQAVQDKCHANTQFVFGKNLYIISFFITTLSYHILIVGVIMYPISRNVLLFFMIFIFILPNYFSKIITFFSPSGNLYPTSTTRSSVT